MRAMRVRVGIMAAGIAIAWGGSALAAPSDRMMSVTTIRFVMPAKLSSACTIKLHQATTTTEATAALSGCKISFDRDRYTKLKSKTPPAEWEADLHSAPIGRVTLRTNGNFGTFFVVDEERILGMATLADAFPIRRVLYEGVLDRDMQQALGPIHDIDGVIRVLREHKVSFVEDGGTLLARSVPEDVAKTLTDKPGEPIVIQSKDHGVIYARRAAQPFGE